MKYIAITISWYLFVVSMANTESPPNGFILIKGAEFQKGTGSNQTGARVRLEDFEILDHPVTNLEYSAFVEKTGYPAPLHWRDGMIPAGKESHPVIFVNRKDVKAYLDWLTETEGRIYRLPTSVEFEYAARGGLENQTYPWGSDTPTGNANFNETNARPFNRWMDYLEPATSRTPNGYGLYGMAGNVWQMVDEHFEPAMQRFQYRVEDTTDLENGVMGGSWAMDRGYLQNGYRLGISHGIRYPDLGFRPVREPQGAGWKIVNRKLSALSLGNGSIFLSWACYSDDSKDLRFHVYRSTARNHAGFRVTPDPIPTSNFVDSGLTLDTRYQYYIRPVDRSGREGNRSEWVGVTASRQPDTALTVFKPLYRQGSLVPIFGDLDGDGVLDCVIRLDNGNQEMSQDPGIPVQIEAFTSYGRSLWRKDICKHDHCFGSANNVPFNVWDMDGDGKAEVITRQQIGEEVFVAILDGMSGDMKYKAPWPEMVSDFARSSTRIHMSIAYLDGENPAVITQTGLYENEVFTAYDAQLNQLWEYKSFAETSGSGGHKIEVADVDGDGKQEVFDGTTCLNHDGTLRWSIYRQHPDIVSIHDYLPDRPGLEVFYIVESSVHAGVYMVDADSGETIWKVNREDDPRWTHGHYGWTADIWEGSPGIECLSNRAGHDDRNVVLFGADGRVLLEPFPYGYTPLEWDGDHTRELYINRTIGDFDGTEIHPSVRAQPILQSSDSILMAADLYGDFRDELIVASKDETGKSYISVVCAVEPIEDRYAARTESLDYRLWLSRNMGGGYKSVFDNPLQSLE